MLAKNNTIFYILLSVLILCKLFYWFFVYPNPDEAYYWHWGQFPALSYHDHPGLHANIQGIFHNLFGRSFFVLRLPVFICSLICGYVIFLITKKLHFKNNFLYIIFFFSCPLFFLFTSFAWNDYLLITNCILSGYFAINFLHDKWINKKGSSKDVFLACLFLGLAMISKYNAIFLGLGILSVIIFNKKLHSVFSDYRFYLGILLSILVSSPILIWNLQNKFGSFEFNLQQRTLKPLLNFDFNGNILGFLIGSLVMLSPFLWWGIFKFWKAKEEKSTYHTVYKVFAKHVFLVSSIVFLFLSLFSNVLYYWNIVGYIFILPLASNMLIKAKKVIASLSFSAVLVAGAIFHFGVVPLTSIFGGSDQDSTYHYGWNEVVSKINSLKNEHEDAFVFTSSYRKASLLAFGLNNKEVYSFSPRFDQFDYWTKYLDLEKDKVAIILTDDRKRINNDLKNLMGSVEVVDTLEISKFSYPVKKYFVYKGKLK